VKFDVVIDVISVVAGLVTLLLVGISVSVSLKESP
jgi:hypothetical protein